MTSIFDNLELSTDFVDKAVDERYDIFMACYAHDKQGRGLYQDKEGKFYMQVADRVYYLRPGGFWTFEQKRFFLPPERVKIIRLEELKRQRAELPTVNEEELGNMPVKGSKVVAKFRLPKQTCTVEKIDGEWACCTTSYYVANSRRHPDKAVVMAFYNEVIAAMMSLDNPVPKIALRNRTDEVATYLRGVM